MTEIEKERWAQRIFDLMDDWSFEITECNMGCGYRYREPADIETEIKQEINKLLGLSND